MKARVVLLLALILVGCVSQKRRDRSAARSDLGGAYIREGNAAGALTVLLEATDLDPRNYEAWNKLAIAYMNLNALDKSEAAFKRALRLEPDKAEVNNNYGLLLLRLDRVTDAIEHFEIASEDLEYRKQAMVLSNLGWALHLAKLDTKALQRLDEAVHRAPNLCEARFHRGLVHRSMNATTKALDDFEAVIRLCEGDAAGAYYQAAEVLLEAGDRTGACVYLEHLVDGAPPSTLTARAAELSARECA